MVSPGVGEGPGTVAEQLAFKKGVGQCRAVHRHKRLLAARGQVVNRPGEELLACSAGAFDQHVTAARGHLRKQIEQAQHGRAAADDVLEGEPTQKLLLQLLHLAEVLK